MLQKFSLLFLSVFCILLSGCMTNDEKLAAFFDGKTYWQGRNTHRQFMTDRIVDPSTDVLIDQLLSGSENQKKQARFELNRLKDLIEFGEKWSLPRFELLLPLSVKSPVIDGNIKFDEWKQKIEISGSCLAGRRRRYYDGSRMLLAFDKDMLYIAAYIPLESAVKSPAVTEEDHILLFFDMPGGSGRRYKECIITPASGKIAASVNWVYCGNGKREQLAANQLEPEIKSAAIRTKHGYSVEIAVPRSLLRIHSNGCIRFNLLRWDKTLKDYRTPIAVPYHGHDPFNRINVRFAGTQAQ